MHEHRDICIRMIIITLFVDSTEMSVNKEYYAVLKIIR